MPISSMMKIKWLISEPWRTSNKFSVSTSCVVLKKILGEKNKQNIFISIVKIIVNKIVTI